MRDFLIKVLGWRGENGITIELFSIWHFLYIFLIIGAIVGAIFLLKTKSQKTKQKTLKILIITTLVLYIVDFMLQPFVTRDNTLDIDKLPFHICTLMSIVGTLAQYSKNQNFKEVSVTMAMAGALMYLTYPGSALGGIAPWSYKVIQTMVCHGMLLAWGVLSLTTGEVKLNYRKMWMPLVGVVCMALWAGLGNLCYNGGTHHYDWFFITGSTFPFIPKYLMPFLAVAAVYGVIACFYLIYWIVEKIREKKRNKLLKQEETAVNVDSEKTNKQDALDENVKKDEHAN